MATPHALVACAILHSDNLVSREELAFRTEAALAHLAARKIHFSDSLATNPDGALHNSLADYIKRKTIDPQNLDGESSSKTPISLLLRQGACTK